MTDNSASETASPNPNQDPSPAKPAQGSSCRMVTLLLILGLGIAALAYDYLVARPGLEQAKTTIEKLLDNSLKDPDGDGTISDKEVHQLLKLTPETVTNLSNGKIEVFTWQSGLPTRKYQLFVVFSGKQVPLLTAFSVNKEPDPSLLPAPTNIAVQEIPADQLKNRKKPTLTGTTRGGTKSGKPKPAPTTKQTPAPAKTSEKPEAAPSTLPGSQTPEKKPEHKTDSTTPKTKQAVPKSTEKKAESAKADPAKKEPAGKNT